MPEFPQGCRRRNGAGFGFRGCPKPARATVVHCHLRPQTGHLLEADAVSWLCTNPLPFPSSPSATMVGLKPPEVPPTAAMKFVSAGVAGCIADLCTFPLDTAKVRLQV